MRFGEPVGLVTRNGYSCQGLVVWGFGVSGLGSGV